jgi:hypothetical protein
MHISKIDNSMIKIIAHRGNINGPQKDLENNPEYLLQAVHKGFDVELDVWVVDGQYYLGHDKPEYITNKNFLVSIPAWCHAKNVEAMEKMQDDGLHYFWHESDKYTITSKGIPWCYPGHYNKHGISVFPDKRYINNNTFIGCGVCTDYCLFYKSCI